MQYKKVLMISINDISSMSSLGVTKKILGQYKAFQNLGCDTFNMCLDNGAGILMHEKEKEVLVRKQVKTYVTYVKLFGRAEEICRKYNIDLCYIRYPMADWVFCRMIKKLHRISHVFVEIPTFPYDYDTKKETNIVTKFNYWQDIRNRNVIRNDIDLIVNYHGYTEIYGVKALPIDNGIDVNSVKYIGDKISFKGNITLIGVALIISIHGYDRIIEGMKEYYEDKEHTRIVNFFIVGDGPETPHLRELVNKYHLNNHVFFTGVKSGKDLDAIFEKSNIAVASLAAHRRGGNTTSELKVKEYSARGIPFIATSRDRTIPEDADYLKLFPANDSSINIMQVVEFADACDKKENLCINLRKFAEHECIWESQIRKILNC